jgi:inner membrane protein
MDNLTHSLTGLMLARAGGFDRWTPRAALLLVLASNIPDIDIVTAIGGPLTYLDHHRGITHGLISVPVLGAFSAAVLRLAGPVRWMPAILMASLGVLVHLLMDWTNIYGIHLYAPFSNQWLRLDITSVVDLWIWVVLGLAVAGPALSRLVSQEIGARAKRGGRGSAVFALVFLLVYTGWRVVLHERAVETLRSHVYEGGVPLSAQAYPHFANPWHWMTVVRTQSAVILQPVNLLHPYDPTGGVIHYPPAATPQLQAARASDTFQRYLDFATEPVWRVIPVDEPEGAVEVIATDVRFGDPGGGRFQASALVDAQGRVLEDSFSFGPVKPR